MVLKKTNFRENISLKKEILKFLGLFLLLYLAVFIVLSISGWLVRPKKIEPSSVPQGSQEKIECVFSEKPDSILIPKIGVEAPLFFQEATEGEELKKALDQGVVHYSQSSLPGEEGRVLLLGHSAPLGWPKIRYDWVFSDLNNLVAGDEIYVFFENCQYIYRVSDKYFLERGEELPTDELTNSKSVLILISCWPPGKDIRRIAVIAIEIEQSE